MVHFETKKSSRTAFRLIPAQFKHRLRQGGFVFTGDSSLVRMLAGLHKHYSTDCGKIRRKSAGCVKEEMIRFWR